MKKSMISVAVNAAIVFAAAMNANAQEGLKLGVEVTPQMSWLFNQDDRDNSNFEYLPTFKSSFGISSQYNFREGAGIGLDALYSFQGQRYKLNGTERIKKVEYLKIPLMFVYSYKINDNLMFIGKIGPQFDLLMNARLTDADGNNIVSDQKKAYGDFDIGAMIAAGAGCRLTDNLSLDVSLRFDYGITDAENKDYKTNINNPGDVASVDGTSSRVITNNITAGLTIGLRYLFGK